MNSEIMLMMGSPPSVRPPAQAPAPLPPSPEPEPEPEPSGDVGAKSLEQAQVREDQAAVASLLDDDIQKGTTIL